MNDAAVYLELAFSKVAPISIKVNKMLSSFVKSGSEGNRLLVEDKTANLLPDEQVLMSSQRVWRRSVLVYVVYAVIFVIFIFPFTIVVSLLSSFLAFLLLFLISGPVLLVLTAGAIAEMTQKNVTLTNMRIIKEIGLGRNVSIWYRHVTRFDKVSFPDNTGVLFYTLPRTAFGKEVQVRYRLENINEVDDAFTFAENGGTDSRNL